MFGSNGRILVVDLSAGRIETETYDEQLARKFLGGNGLAAKMIHGRVPPDADPLGPDNAVVFTVGPLTATPVWGTSRGHVAAISPLTGFFADSNYGGDFATAQKCAGYDAIFITGAASDPVYLLVTDDTVEIRDASALWGKTTFETMDLLKAEVGQDALAATIGPAGENGVLFANIICAGSRHGAAGRAGLGAVLGAKKMKAIVARGGTRPSLAQSEALQVFLKERLPALRKNAAALHDIGTPVLVNMINAKGVLGTRNNTRETFDGAAAISGEVIKEKHTERNTACRGCPVACGKTVRVSEGEFAGRTVKMPEYETLYAMGSMLENGDLQSIFNGNHVCDQMGMDTISLGVTLAFVAECLERGLTNESQLSGRIEFGGGKDLVRVMQQTARKDGIGALIALGSARLAQRFGAEAEKLLYAVRGLEIAGHSARGLRGMSLAYSTSTRGGSHHDARPDYSTVDQDPGFTPQPEYAFKSQCATAVGDSLGMCRFTIEKGLGALIGDELAQVVECVTGWGLDAAALAKAGERIYNLERLINVGRGLRRQHDTLPYRVMHEPIPDGPAKGRYCSPAELNRMLDSYYALRGWSDDGVPGPAKLAELGLEQDAAAGAPGRSA